MANFNPLTRSKLSAIHGPFQQEPISVKKLDKQDVTWQDQKCCLSWCWDNTAHSKTLCIVSHCKEKAQLLICMALSQKWACQGHVFMTLILREQLYTCNKLLITYELPINIKELISSDPNTTIGV
jgi:hypothetical protein